MLPLRPLIPPRAPSWGGIEFLTDGVWPPTLSVALELQEWIDHCQLYDNNGLKKYPDMPGDRPYAVPQFHIYLLDLFLRSHCLCSIFLQPCCSFAKLLLHNLTDMFRGFVVSLVTSWAVFGKYYIVDLEGPRWVAILPPGTMWILPPLSTFPYHLDWRMWDWCIHDANFNAFWY